MSTTKRLTKAFSDSIPLGPHPDPHAEWIHVRLDFVQEAIDHMDWLEKGNAEWRAVAQAKWRAVAQANAKHAEAARATARVAIRHLQLVLNTARSHDEQQKVDTEARDWLVSIGSEP